MCVFFNVRVMVEDLEQTPELLTLETDGNRWEPETKFQKAAATLALARAAAPRRSPNDMASQSPAWHWQPRSKRWEL